MRKKMPTLPHNLRLWQNLAAKKENSPASAVMLRLPDDKTLPQPDENTQWIDIEIFHEVSGRKSIRMIDTIPFTPLSMQGISLGLIRFGTKTQRKDQVSK
jgi:hypothetical protein